MKEIRLAINANPGSNVSCDVGRSENQLKKVETQVDGFYTQVRSDSVESVHQIS